MDAQLACMSKGHSSSFRGRHVTARAVQVYPHGSTDSLPYATMGSGSLNAMAVFESSYEEDLDKDKAVDLVTRAIRCCSDTASSERIAQPCMECHA